MIQPQQPSAELAVLHAMRCIGHAGAQRVATASGLTAGEVDRELDRLRRHGLVELDEGVFGGWSLTRAGRDFSEAAVRREVREAGAVELVDTAYRDFLPLNRVVMGICHDWQMRSLGGRPIVNDHEDHRYDDSVLARLSSADAAAQEICERLAQRLTRFEVYGRRLAYAARRSQGGDIRFVTEDLESYHSIWFQLHEDLLVTCGISRDDERWREAEERPEGI
ncbi:MAG TPA: transcriptional regulator [Acidimicrobiia bacterium]|nr:transcriptional regulator [Acidimicrobiia bacterium]